MNRLLGSFLSAFVFGLGLAISGMIDPAKVQGFLDISGRWDPSMAFVMAGALVVTALGYAWLRKRGEGLGGRRLQWPTQRTIDLRLVAGSALFGAGWGLSGYCPGPVIGSLASAGIDAMVFVAAMILAMFATLKLVNKSAN